MKAAIRKLLDSKSLPKKPKPRNRRLTYKSIDKLCEGHSALCREAMCWCLHYMRADATVYFLRCGEFVKIGYTLVSVESRIVGLMIGCPYDYELLLSLPGGGQLEARLHKSFSEDHHRGEWFRLSDEIKDFINLAATVDFPRKSFTFEDMQKELERVSLLKECSLITT